MELFEKEEALEAVLSDVENLMEELYQSGFDSVHDSTLEALEHMARRTAAYGLELLSDLLSQLHHGLAMRRHQMENGTDLLLSIYAKLNQYTQFCQEKIEQDKGIRYYLASC